MFGVYLGIIEDSSGCGRVILMRIAVHVRIAFLKINECVSYHEGPIIGSQGTI